MPENVSLVGQRNERIPPPALVSVNARRETAKFNPLILGEVHTAGNSVGAQVRSVAVLFRWHVDFEDGFQYHHRSRHHHAVGNPRDTLVELHSFPTNLWDWLRSSTHFIRCVVSGLSS